MSMQLLAQMDYCWRAAGENNGQGVMMSDENLMTARTRFEKGRDASLNSNELGLVLQGTYLIHSDDGLEEFNVMLRMAWRKHQRLKRERR